MISESKEIVEASKGLQSQSTYMQSSQHLHNHLRVQGVESQSKADIRYGLIKIRDEVRNSSRNE
jgi:hypothetical protein